MKTVSFLTIVMMLYWKFFKFAAIILIINAPSYLYEWDQKLYFEECGHHND